MSGDPDEARQEEVGQSEHSVILAEIMGQDEEEWGEHSEIMREIMS